MRLQSERVEPNYPTLLCLPGQFLSPFGVGHNQIEEAGLPAPNFGKTVHSTIPQEREDMPGQETSWVESAISVICALGDSPAEPDVFSMNMNVVGTARPGDR